jgi:hypothetical protein
MESIGWHALVVYDIPCLPSNLIERDILLQFSRKEDDMGENKLAATDISTLSLHNTA